MGVHESAVLGSDCKFVAPELVNVFGCTIGDGCMIGPFVDIQAGVIIGHRCRIQSHSFVCSGTSLGDFVFIGHGVMFTNDAWPRAANWDHSAKGAGDWIEAAAAVGNWVSIGSSAVILPGVRIGDYATVGAGSVVTRDVDPYAVVVGNPARKIADLRETDHGPPGH